MDQQLFADSGPVPRANNAAGAVPVSMALHAMAIGAAIVVSGAMRAAAPVETKPGPLLYRADVARAVNVNPTVVRISPPARGSGGGHPRADQSFSAAAPAPPAPLAPVTFHENANIVDEAPALEPSSGTSAQPDNLSDDTGGCAGCAPGPGAAVDDGGGPGDGGSPLRVGDLVTAPRRLHGTAPLYPSLARQIGLSGTVTLDCVIGPDGHVRDVRVLSGPPLLQQAAVDSVRQWSYTEPKLYGRPISVLLTVTVHFVLAR
jgi:protein TonB